MDSDKALDILIETLKKENELGLLNKAHWMMIKKYKNPQGHTCRDFFNEQNNKKMILVTDKDTEKVSLIPNENFLFYIINEEVKPLFAYAPFISNSGLSFCFALIKDLKDKKTITTGGEKMLEMLIQRLKTIFIENSSQNKDKSIILLGRDNMILITDYDANLIIDKLEQNNFRFNSDIFNYYKNQSFQPVYPDLLDIRYHFPEDQGKTSNQSMETVFSVLSKGPLTDETYTRVRKLIRRISLEDLNLSQKIISDINIKERSKTKRLVEIEIKRRKLKDFLS